ncbi:hypothetical protein R1sor_001006 [Riccia sorocarpa]|uniref:Translation elongation factor EF1B beta/delta subunit guanine nucleotide exchange domain-containing protein n=1 Tax=Riccia sorocarpa TaxID=122646 RepID=A0ABD3H0S4_9MARC
MAINFDVTTEGGLAHLDNYLLTRSFISGPQPSRDDLTVFAALGYPPTPNFVNLTRWYSQIKRLVDTSFPGESVGVGFNQGQAVGLQENSDVEDPPSPRTRASTENSRRAPEEAIQRTAEDESASRHRHRNRHALENGHGQENGDVPHHPVDEAHQEVETLATFQEAHAQTQEGTVSLTGGESSILLDVKPWDDETDMVALEAAVRAIQLPGLHWGASKLEPVAFKISKLQIMMTIEDELISPETIIEEHLTAPPANEHIQSCDIVAWNKICK